MKKLEQLFQWQDHYCVGNSTVDAQHRQLFALLERLQQALYPDDSRSLIAETLEKLLGATRQHFQDEEAIMARAQYPRLDEHKITHRKLIDELLQLRKEFLDGGSVHTIELLVFLKDWLTRHILEEDRLVGVYIADSIEKKRKKSDKNSDTPSPTAETN
jgi:hemerythrin